MIRVPDLPPFAELDWSTADLVDAPGDKQYRQAIWLPGTVAEQAVVQAESWGPEAQPSECHVLNHIQMGARIQNHPPLGGLLHAVGIQAETSSGPIKRARLVHPATTQLSETIDELNTTLPKKYSITPVDIFKDEVYPPTAFAESLALEEPAFLMSAEAFAAAHDQIFHCVWLGLGKMSRLAFRDWARAVLNDEVPFDPQYTPGDTPLDQMCDRFDVAISVRGINETSLRPNGRNATLLPYAFQRALPESSASAVKTMAADTWQHLAFLEQHFR